MIKKAINRIFHLRASILHGNEALQSGREIDRLRAGTRCNPKYSYMRRHGGFAYEVEKNICRSCRC